VERIAAKLLHNPVRSSRVRNDSAIDEELKSVCAVFAQVKLHVGKSGVLVANEKIKQEVIVLSQHDKPARLVDILVSITWWLHEFPLPCENDRRVPP